jgi:glycosyltransferase involved in cell wall biosynthesis
MVYIANARIPTEKANGLQIMQNCEAFAQAGAEVQLWIPARRNTADLDGVDPFLYYGVARRFTIERLPCLDLLPLVPDRTDALARAIFWVQWATFTLAAFVRALSARADVFYSRDALILLALSWARPRRALAYEAHSMTRIGRMAARRVGRAVTTTRRLAEAMSAAGAARVLAAHDGIQAARFETLLDRAAARWAVGWETDAFIVGYVGRLHTMGMDKGVGRLVEALASREGVALALVGGPDDMAAALHDRWIALGGREKDFLYAGQVAPERVAVYIRAFDVCALPLPWTEHFAHYASPMKLFEYMAAGRPIIASDLPSTREVLTEGETALFFPPDDVEAIRAAVERLRSDPALRGELAAHGRALALEKYTWEARARAILAFLEAG